MEMDEFKRIAFKNLLFICLITSFVSISGVLFLGLSSLPMIALVSIWIFFGFMNSTYTIDDTTKRTLEKFELRKEEVIAELKFNKFRFKNFVIFDELKRSPNKVNWNILTSNLFKVIGDEDLLSVSINQTTNRFFYKLTLSYVPEGSLSVFSKKLTDYIINRDNLL
jgi:hypothetical protein